MQAKQSNDAVDAGWRFSAGLAHLQNPAEAEIS
jgi:hypothetical protein